MGKKVLSIMILEICVISFFINCNSSTKPKETKGSIQGTVNNVLSGDVSIIHPAYIFLEDSLLATTDEYGNYSISIIEEGAYQFTCSALNYRDTTKQVQVIGGKTVTIDFYLTPDSSTGRIYGEFQDIIIFNNSLEIDSSLTDWDAKQIFEGVTGATIQRKTLLYDVPDRKVYLSDSLLAISDGFGQYWFEIQCGTYCIKGSCEGYNDATQVIKVLPNTRIYVNFFLARKVAAKLALK